MELQDEHRLLHQIRQGNQEAFAELVEPFIAKAYHIAIAILRSPHLAEEAVQNALIETYRTIVAGKEIRNFAGWFGRVIANRSWDLARKESRFQSIDLDNVTVRDTSAPLIETFLRKEQSSEILDAVMSLDVRLRTVIVLYYFQDMKIDEIASVLQTSEGTVKTRLHRARLRLANLLSDEKWNAKVVPLC